MVRLYVFAEGQTEQTFADTLLKPHLANYGVYMSKPVLIATAKKRGRIYRGGGRNYMPIRNDIDRFLKQENSRDVFFTTMIDLYALHSGFPGLEESNKLRCNPLERVQFLEQCFFKDIDDSRFIPYLQMHEYEAYLFADPSCFENLASDTPEGIASLQAIARQFEQPELINDGPETAPSKRIISFFPKYKKAKRVFGPLLAESIGLPKIRERCPHFNQWVAKLESLGSG